MPKYRKKPVEIEAVLFANPWKEVREFAPEVTFIREPTGNRIAFGVVHTLEGDMRAEVGDMLIRGVQGELYPCKPDIFEATYELVEGPPVSAENPADTVVEQAWGEFRDGPDYQPSDRYDVRSVFEAGFRAALADPADRDEEGPANHTHNESREGC